MINPIPQAFFEIFLKRTSEAFNHEYEIKCVAVAVLIPLLPVVKIIRYCWFCFYHYFSQQLLYTLLVIYSVV